MIPKSCRLFGQDHAQTQGDLDAEVRPDWFGEIEVIEAPKRKRRPDNRARLTRERTQQENALDEALKDTFPASDPVSAEQPISHAAKRDGAKT
jgi:hypothetical protein